MKPFATHRAARRRILGIVGLLGCAAFLGAFAPLAGADQDVDLASAGLTELGDPTVSTPAPTTEAAAAAEATPAPTSTLDAAKLATMSKPQLRALVKRVHGEWIAAQSKLQIIALRRDEADQLVDAALQLYGVRLTAAFERGDDVTVTALRAAREELDPTQRRALVANLAPEDAVVVDRHITALAAVDAAAKAVDAQQQVVVVAGSDVDLARAALEDRMPAQPKGESINTKYVFATGPIPGIGYWGSVSGGGMLTGWTGLAGAALGGVGCDQPPTPGLTASGVTEQGEASWYGPGFHGNNTANGEVYDQEQMTAAHKTLPFGTIVRVYSQSTAQCAFVRINDRGPFVDGRIIDLSHAAAQAIGMDGTAPVQIEIWATPGTAVAPITEPASSAPAAA